MKHKRLTLLLATLLLTGCTGTAQVQNRAFVQLLGADADRNANRVTAVSFGMEEPASGTGETLLTALEAAQCRYDRALMLGHTQVLVCGKGELEQRLSLLLDGNRISPGCRLVCADDAAKVLEETGAGLETALSRMAEGGALYAPAVSDTLSDLLGASGMAVAPYVSGSDLGMCVVDRAGNIRTTLSEEACRGVALLRGKNRDTVLGIPTEQGTLSYEIHSCSYKLDLETAEGLTAVLSFRITGECAESCEQGQLRKGVQQAVTELCRAAVLETVCVYGVDLLDLERAARHQDPAFFAAHQEEWSAVIAQAGFRCEVRVE